MKKSILFLLLFLPVLSYGYPITITNSGHSKNLVILPISPHFSMGNSSLQVGTMSSCLASPEGLSVMGSAATIPPQTTVTYNFNIPSDFLSVCPNIYYITANATGNGTLMIANTYNVGLTKTQATQQPAFTFVISYYYEHEGTAQTTVQLQGLTTPYPQYVIFPDDRLSMTVNADEMPGSE